jgi:hypothetical protein
LRWGLENFSPGCPATPILLISASQVARIIGMSLIIKQSWSKYCLVDHYGGLLEKLLLLSSLEQFGQDKQVNVAW